MDDLCARLSIVNQLRFSYLNMTRMYNRGIATDKLDEFFYTLESMNCDTTQFLTWFASIVEAMRIPDNQWSKLSLFVAWNDVFTHFSSFTVFKSDGDQFSILPQTDPQYWSSLCRALRNGCAHDSHVSVDVNDTNWSNTLVQKAKTNAFIDTTTATNRLTNSPSIFPSNLNDKKKYVFYVWNTNTQHMVDIIVACPLMHARYILFIVTTFLAMSGNCLPGDTIEFKDFFNANSFSAILPLTYLKDICNVL